MASIVYVTYDEDGKLTGFYQQEVLPEHEDAYFQVDQELWMTWFNYQMNAARDALEPYVPPPPDPEET